MPAATQSPAENRVPFRAALVASWKLSLALAVTTAALVFAAFPSANLSEAAFIFAVPLLVWATRSPDVRVFAATVFTAWFWAWFFLIDWLHHVTTGGMIFLSAFLALLSGSWFLAARWTLPRTQTASSLKKITVAAGLAGLWVLIEWIRGWIFTGFPWLPLAASQWQRPVMLSLCPITGAHGVSFILVFANLGIADYLTRIFSKEKRSALGWISPLFTCALVAVLCSTVGLFSLRKNLPEAQLTRVGIVQPHIAQSLKWDPAYALENLRTLETETLRVAALKPDFILWPEASTPWALGEKSEIRPWLEKLAHRAEVPIVVGVVYVETSDASGDRWLNALAVIDPEHGLQKTIYAKRHLVPFGEYVPLRSLLGWLEKITEVGQGDFLKGTSAAPLAISARSRPIQLGGLICYEDIFSELARDTARSGAQLIAVATNNAWYGEGSMAPQHAAHSVLRAAETGLPVVRASNSGWGGWIDGRGVIREMLTDERGSIYFRGSQVFEITAPNADAPELTFFTHFGNWFVVCCAIFAALGTFLVFSHKKSAASQLL